MLPLRTKPENFMHRNEQQDYFHTLNLAVNKTIFNKEFHEVFYENHCCIFIKQIDVFPTYQVEIISQVGRMRQIKTYYINKQIINKLVKPNLSIHFHDIRFQF